MIIDQIDREILTHANSTGITPTKIYLGREEWRELKAYALRVAAFVMKDAKGYARPEYRGAKVYRVNEYSYLAVGL